MRKKKITMTRTKTDEELHRIRLAIWSVVSDCMCCKREECTEHCSDFVDVEMDDIMHRIDKLVKGEDDGSGREDHEGSREIREAETT